MPKVSGVVGSKSASGAIAGRAIRSAAAGHDAHSIVQQSLSGQPDDKVISVCTSEGRALVTLDLDFANIHAYPPGNSAIGRMLSVLAVEPLHGLLWIVEDHRIRIHE